MYMNILVTVKNEYLIRIKNLLTKLIFDGLNSIYTKTREVSVNDDVLKVFQSLLKRVPKWTDEILNNEVMRIRSVLDLDNNFDLLNNLVKASIKATYNIMVFGSKVDYDINSLLNEFNFKDLIRNIYIETSREIYNNPFLFYHLYTPVEIKRNQREVLTIIGESIDESIRKLLPIKIILDSYINTNNINNFKVDYPNELFDHNDGLNLMDNYVDKDLENDIFNVNNKPSSPKQILSNPISPKQLLPNEIQSNQNMVVPISPNSIIKLNQNNNNNNLVPIPVPEMRGGNNDSSIKVINSEVKISSSSNENSVQNKILDIINEKSLDLNNKETNISEFENTNSNQSNVNKSLDGGSNRANSDSVNSVDNTFIANENHPSLNNSVNNGKLNSNSNNNSNNNSNSNAKDIFQSASNKINQINKSQSELDSKLEKLLKNDLGDSDTDSTLAVDNQSNYQEVFSNSNSSHDSSLNSQQKNDEINKSKFFANYLNV